MDYSIREKDGLYYIDRQAPNGTVLIGQVGYSTFEAAEKYLSELKKEN